MNRKTSIFTALIIGLCLAALLCACTSGSAKHTQQSLTPDVQAQLSALQTPQGVDPAVFRQLKDELVRQFALCGKTASTPPTGAANAPANLRIIEEGLIDVYWLLHWEYRNAGDYDQNGTVGVADITQIAMHFGHDPGTDGLDIVIHPSGVGKVGVSDVTAIAMNFGANVTGYALDEAPAESGPWTDLESPLISELMLTETGGWRDYGRVITPTTGNWYRVVPVDSGSVEGEPSAAVQFGGGGGTAPTITDVQPQTGETGTVLTPNVAYTGDPATTVVWDFGGGANPNTSSGLSPSVTLGAPGSYPSSITLTNGAGSDTFNFTLVVTGVSGVWQYYKVVDFANTGNYISFALIFGKPAFAYINGAFGTIHYVRSNVELPTSSSDWVDMLADGGSVNFYDGNISLAEDQYATPVIMGWEDSGSAYFLGSTVPEPSIPAEWEVSEIGLADEAGSLALANGEMYATLKYVDGLHFYQATSYPPTGTQDWTDALVDATMGTGGNSKLVWNHEDDNFYIFYNTGAESLNAIHCSYADALTTSSWVAYRASASTGGLSGEYYDYAFDPTPLSTDLFYCYTREIGGMKRFNGVLGYEDAANPNSFTFGMIASDDLANNGEMCSLAFGGGYVMTAYRGNDVTQLIYNASPYSTGILPFGWAPEVVPEVSLSPVTDTNILVYNNTDVMIVYGREDGIYFAAMTLP